jgi:hypothetical protein
MVVVRMAAGNKKRSGWAAPFKQEDGDALFD